MKAVIRGVIAGGAIIAAGVIIILIALALNGWSVRPKYEMKSYSSQSEISELKIQMGAGSVKCEFYDGEEIYVEYPSSNGCKTSFTEEGGTLTFSVKSKWYMHLGFGVLNLPTTTVKLPESLKGKLDLAVRLDAGSAEIASGEFANVTVDIDAGQLIAGDITADCIRCDADAGQIKIAGACCNTLKITVDAGHATVDKIDALTTEVTVDAGHARLGFVSDRTEYTVSVHVDAGSCNVGNSTGASSRKITVDVDAGSAQLYFGI